MGQGPQVITDKRFQLAVIPEISDIMSGEVPQVDMGQVRWQPQLLGR